MLVALHIPKTGGTSFRSLLSNHFGCRFLMDNDDRPLSVEEDERQRNALAYNPDLMGLVDKYDCIHGHFLAAKYSTWLGSSKHDFITWMRDPVQRVISRYHHHVRYAGSNGKELLSMTAFCEQTRLHNTYAKYLWSVDISKFSFVGILEDYESSLKLFSQKFDIPLPFDMIKKNLNPERSSGQAYVVDNDLYSYLCEMNAQDVEIYEQAKIVNRLMLKRTVW